MNQIAGRVNKAYRKKVPDADIFSIKIGLVKVMKKPVTINENVPIDAAIPLMRVGKISPIITQTIGP